MKGHGAGSGKFEAAETLIGSDGDGTPRIGVRFQLRSGDLWFALFAEGFERPVFSGLVSKSWPDDLRKLAGVAEARLAAADLMK